MPKALKHLSQKRAFEKLITYLYVLRMKGCSWAQIAELLNTQCGFGLAPGTVRTYFGEFSILHRASCLAAMNNYLSAKGAKKGTQ